MAYYVIAGKDKLTMYISVNGESAAVLTVANTANGNTIGTASITANLHAGNNTIEFSNPSAIAPDIDRIVV
jgi:DNA-binding MurR/RpiR family transcriptional regulator